jgi:hypothetical protein
VFDIVNGIGAEPSVEVGPVGAHSADIPRRRPSAPIDRRCA